MYEYLKRITVMVLALAFIAVPSAYAQDNLEGENLAQPQDQVEEVLDEADDSVDDVLPVEPDNGIGDGAETLDDLIEDDPFVTSTTTSDELTPEEEQLAALLGGGFLVVMVVVMIAYYIYFAITLSTTAKKLGMENSYLAWIPVANVFYIYMVAGLNPLLALLSFLVVPYVYAWMKISERRGASSWLGLLIILNPLDLFLMGYLAWGDLDNSGMESSPAEAATTPEGPTEISA